MLRHIFIIPLTLLKFLYLVFVGIVKKLTPYALSWKKSVADKIVLITGAGSGIGRETAIRFAREGATLVLWDVDATGNAKTARLVQECCVKAYTYVCDVTKREEVYRVAQRVQDEVGKVYILVNNAGIVAGKAFLDLKDDEIRKTMEVNTMAHFWTLKAFLPGMVHRDEGHVVTIASILGETGIGGLSEYCASKFAVRGLHDSILRELAVINSQVKCTVVCPFGISTGMFDGVKLQNEFLLRFMQPEYVGKKIVQAVLTDVDVLYLPPVRMQLLVVMKTLLPTPATLLVEEVINLNEATKTFTGRRKGSKLNKEN